MEQKERKKFNWIGFAVELVKLVASFLIGSQYGN